MIFGLFPRTPREPIIASLYGTIVAQARAPIFYWAYRVPDTINGRFEMITLHAVLVLQRLEQGPEPIRRLGQGVFDRYCQDLDDSMRELGVGDLAVPRKMRRIGEAFYGRQRAYRAALAEPGCGLLAAALARNVFGGVSEPEGACRLAAYVREAAGRIGDQDGFERGELVFPDPEEVPSRVQAGTGGRR